MIVAGSDTTAATLTHIFYHLALDSTLVTKLRNELRTTAPGDSKFLAALINETLRLHPPVPSGVLRQTPASGLRFGDTFIPGGVTISMPTWSLGRCASHIPPSKISDTDLLMLSNSRRRIPQPLCLFARALDNVSRAPQEQSRIHALFYRSVLETSSPDTLCLSLLVSR